jgi:hypothetical protein
MTMLVAWLAADSRGPASLYLASDSRITWDGSGSWDRGRKLFSCRKYPYLFGYVGEAFFPSQVLGQVIERIEADLLEASNPEDFAHQVVSLIQDMLRDRPHAVRGDFRVILAQRYGQRMSSTFHVHDAHFPTTGDPDLERCALPQHSDVVGAWGSGARTFRHHYERWASSDIRETSRAMFSAFCDSLAAGGDPLSGAPPQLIGLYRIGAGRPFGLIWEGRRYYCATEVLGEVTTRDVQWHNALFEVCDPQTLERATGAQPQPRPSQVHHLRETSPEGKTGDQQA